MKNRTKNRTVGQTSKWKIEQVEVVGRSPAVQTRYDMDGIISPWKTRQVEVVGGAVALKSKCKMVQTSPWKIGEMELVGEPPLWKTRLMGGQILPLQDLYPNMAGQMNLNKALVVSRQITTCMTQDLEHILEAEITIGMS